MIACEYVDKIVQCHLDHSAPDTFVVGKIIWSGDKWFVMKDILPSGIWNGYALYLVSDIVKIIDNSDYLQRIKMLLAHRGIHSDSLNISSHDPLIELLTYVMNHHRIVSLELLCSGIRDVCGYITSVHKEVIYIMQIDEFGRYDGRSFISVDAITRLFFADEEGQCLEILTKLS